MSKKKYINIFIIAFQSLLISLLIQAQVVMGAELDSNCLAITKQEDLNLYNAYNHELFNKYLIPTKTMNVKFSEEGIDNIALITMVKNEEDIIYGNLIWHFCVGFRKFIIVDNNSTDKTRKLIERFKKETKGITQIFIIDNPIFAKIQSRIMTGNYYYATSIWPEVNWIFPVDADEFWVPETNLSKLLESIPSTVNMVFIFAEEYLPTSNVYFADIKKSGFYKKIVSRNKEQYCFAKMFLKSNMSQITFDHGNHTISNFGNKNNTTAIIITNQGLRMMHFPIRSVEQLHSKYSQSFLTMKAAKEKKYISLMAGLHYNAYQEYLEKYGKNASEMFFKQKIMLKENAIYDPLPIEQALNLYKKITKAHNISLTLY